MKERYRHIASLGIAAAALASCDIVDTKSSPQARENDTPHVSEVTPIDLTLSPITVPMTRYRECTNPIVNVTVPEDMWGNEIVSVTWRGHREGEGKFKPDVNLAQYPSEPNQLSRTLAIPVHTRKMEQYDVIVYARDENGEVIGSDTASMKVGCELIRRDSN